MAGSRAMLHMLARHGGRTDVYQGSDIAIQHLRLDPRTGSRLHGRDGARTPLAGCRPARERGDGSGRRADRYRSRESDRRDRSAPARSARCRTASIEFNAEDIAAFGAGSIADVLEAIAPATQSGARGGRGGGRPVFLINGIRVSSPREFSSYPPEAIEKVEVFPEEVAQRFGYSADQRVVNIILKRNFQAVTAEVEYAQPDRGLLAQRAEATYLRIGETGRLNFNVEVEDTSLLTEGERGC